MALNSCISPQLLSIDSCIFPLGPGPLAFLLSTPSTRIQLAQLHEVETKQSRKSIKQDAPHINDFLSDKVWSPGEIVHGSYRRGTCYKLNNSIDPLNPHGYTPNGGSRSPGQDSEAECGWGVLHHGEVHTDRCVRQLPVEGGHGRPVRHEGWEGESVHRQGRIRVQVSIFGGGGWVRCIWLVDVHLVMCAFIAYKKKLLPG